MSILALFAHWGYQIVFEFKPRNTPRELHSSNRLIPSRNANAELMSQSQTPANAYDTESQVAEGFKIA